MKFINNSYLFTIKNLLNKYVFHSYLISSLYKRIANAIH